MSLSFHTSEIACLDWQAGLQCTQDSFYVMTETKTTCRTLVIAQNKSHWRDSHAITDKVLQMQLRAKTKDIEIPHAGSQILFCGAILGQISQSITKFEYMIVAGDVGPSPSGDAVKRAGTLPTHYTVGLFLRLARRRVTLRLATIAQVLVEARFCLSVFLERDTVLLGTRS